MNDYLELGCPMSLIIGFWVISVCFVFKLRFICAASRDAGEFGVRKCAHEDSGLGTGEPESVNSYPSFSGSSIEGWSKGWFWPHPVS